MKVSPKRLVLIFGSIFVITFLLELSSHLVVSSLPGRSPLAGAFLDATFLSIPALPALVFFVIVPLERHRARREQAEAKYRAIFEHAVHGIYQTTPAGAFITANSAMARILGYSSVEELTTQLTDIASRVYADPERRAEFVRLLERDGVVQDMEYEALRKDGGRRWISETVRAVRDAEGGIRYYEGTLTDLTEQHHLSQSLKDSEIRFRTLFESAQDAIFVMNADVFLDCNLHTELLFGRRKSDIIGRSPLEFSPMTQPDGRLSKEAAGAHIHAALAGSPERFAWQHLRADGTAFDAEVSLKRIDIGGETLLHAIVRDVTERSRAQKALQDSEKLLKESQSIAGLGSYVTDIRAGTWRSSAVLDDIFGIDDQFERTTEGWLALIQPEWQERMSRYFAEEVLGKHRRFDLEYPVVRKSDGKVRWVHGLGELEFDADDTPIRMIGTITDITERKEVDTALRLRSSALYVAANAIVITDVAGVVEWVNPAFTHLTGYTSEEAVGKNPRDLVKSGKHGAAFYKELWETILDGRTWHGEIVNRRKDGSLYTENQAVTPILDESGAISHFVAIKEDITNRLQLEAQFRQSQKMESVGQLASGIAHDFNNLLTVINGLSEFVLEQVGKDDPVSSDVKEIQSAGERAATLTRQLLAFSRQQILEPQVLNLSTVVSGMENLLRRLLGEDIELVVVSTPGVAGVKADPGQIEQVIANLAVNARDAMPEGGRLTIETQNVEIGEDYIREHGVVMQPGSYVQVAVSDAGIGMDEATRARIFEPFFTTKGPTRGTGLGLSTVYGIVKQSHGFIWVYSEVGRGTTFKIYLPQVTKAAGTVRLEPTVVPSFGTETILLADDNAGLLKLATRVLERAGYTALVATTGEEALHLLESSEEPVHLLLTDVVMPGMSGRNLAEQIVQTRPGTKVLYMSGYTSDTIVRHGVLDARSAFLNKPFTATALLRKVREVLDSQG